MNPIVLRSLRWAVLGLVGLVLVFSFALACTFVYLAPSLPTAGKQQVIPLRVFTRSGALVSQIGEQRRIPVEFGDIPPLVRQAVLAAEDDRFFQHSGFDWMGLTRALVMNVVTADAGQGGSTITQQAARNMFLSLDKTLRRKLSEVFVTYRMESRLTKEEIFATYLNVILFGHRSYGIAAAAETYYGKRLDELTVAQAATLAGIIQLPSRQNPITNPKLAESRRAYVLRRMTEVGYIDRATAEAAAKEPVASRGFAPLIDVEGAYVAEMARQEIVSRYGEAAVNAGYKVYTTLDDRLQTGANRALRLGLLDYDRRHGYRGRLGTMEIPAAPVDTELDAALDKYPAVGPLEPAVVLAVAATSAEIHVRGQGKARIAWDGLSWAARAQGVGVGPAPRKATDVVKPGDVIYAVTDGHGNAQLGQVPRAQAALVALDPKDGAIVALAGGFDFYSNQFNRVVQARRQPGSSFKPFLYSAALESGFTPASIFNDAPVMVDDSGSEENWRPENSSGKFLGPMRLREALVWSKNMVSIRVLQEVGVSAFIEHASRFGFDKAGMPRNATLALGTLSTTPLQMASGFAVFANGGFKVEPYFIARIEDAAGQVVYEATPVMACAECEQSSAGPLHPLEPEAAPSADVAAAGGPGIDAAVVDAGVAGDTVAGATSGSTPGEMLLSAPEPAPLLRGMDGIPAELRELASIQGGRGYLAEGRLAPRVLSPQNAWLMSDIMHDVTTRGTARRTQQLGRDDLAGKTGTTNEGRDNWFNGFTHELVASVWVGHDDFQSLGEREEGATTAVPIWMHFMREALQGSPSSRLPRPGGLIDLQVSPHTGARAAALDPEAITETFMFKQLPRFARPGEAGDTPAEPGAEPGTSGTKRGEPLF